MHNLLQGGEGELTAAEKETYIGYNRSVTRLLDAFIPKPDVLVVHHPQPAAILHLMGDSRPRAAIWRCHIDTSLPNALVWKFLVSYLTSVRPAGIFRPRICPRCLPAGKSPHHHSRYRSIVPEKHADGERSGQGARRQVRH